MARLVSHPAARAAALALLATAAASALAEVTTVSAAILTAGGATAGATAAATVAAAGWVGATVVAVVSTGYALAASFIMTALLGSSKGSSNAADNGFGHMIRSPIEPRRRVYGRAAVSGPMVYSPADPLEDHHLHIVVPLADHESAGIDTVWVGDHAIEPGDIGVDGWVLTAPFIQITTRTADYQLTIPAVAPFTVTIPDGPIYDVIGAGLLAATETAQQTELVPGPNPPALGQFFRSGNTLTVNAAYAGAPIGVTVERRDSWSALRIRKFLGAPGQAASSELIAASRGEWDASCTFDGVTYIIVTLVGWINAYPNGIPNIRALVRGRKVLDPRSGLTVYSENPALQIYDYLRDPEGFDCAADEINLDAVIAAANICDELVAIDATTTQRRYMGNGAYAQDDEPDTVLAQLAAAMAGWCPYFQGEYSPIAGAYTGPVMTFTPDHLRGTIQVQPKPGRRETFNAARAVFVDPAQGWQPVDAPVVTNPAYVTEDGEDIAREFSYSFVADRMQVQRLQKIALERGRQGITVQFPANLAALGVRVGEMVALDMPLLGWTGKVFRVTGWKFAIDAGVDLVLQEESASSYDWNYGDATVGDPAPNTTLPDGRPSELDTLAAESGNATLYVAGDGQVRARVRVTWDAITEPFVTNGGHVHIQTKRLTDPEWTDAPPVPGSATGTYIEPVRDGDILVIRARVFNAIGQSSDWYAVQHLVIGQTAPPPAVTSAVLAVLGDGTRRLTWAYAAPPADLAAFEIRYHASATDWASMTVLDRIASPAAAPVLRWEGNAPPAGTYNVAIRALDTSGNYSAASALIAGAVLGAEPSVFVSGAGINLAQNATLLTSGAGVAPAFARLTSNAVVPWTFGPPVAGHLIGGESGGIDVSLDTAAIGALDTLQLSASRINGTAVLIEECYPAAPGERWQFSAYVAVSGMAYEPVLQWFNAAGGALGEVVGAAVTAAEGYVGGTLLAGYKRVSVLADAPAGTAYVHGAIRRVTGAGASVGAVMRARRWFIGLANPGQADPSPWAPGAIASPIDTVQIAPGAATGTARATGTAITPVVNTSYEAVRRRTGGAYAVLPLYEFIAVTYFANASGPIEVSLQGECDIEFGSTFADNYLDVFICASTGDNSANAARVIDAAAAGAHVLQEFSVKRTPIVAVAGNTYVIKAMALCTDLPNTTWRFDNVEMNVVHIKR